MSYQRWQWANDWLVLLGNKTPLPSIVEFVVAWTCLETAPSPNIGAAYNLLNTRHTEGTKHPTTDYNSAGVKNFFDYTDGLIGNMSALHDGFYPALKAALETNNEKAMGLPHGPIPAGILTELSKWSGGTNYGIKLLSLMGVGLTDIFSGTRQPPVLASITVQVRVDGSKSSIISG